MPFELKLFSVSEVADRLGLKKERERKALAEYISRKKLGQKFGHSRMLSEAEISICQHRREGRPKKNSQMST